MKKTEVIIAGAGLAGLTAGLELQEEGYSVTVIEANGFTGGRAASWISDGMEVESGLHRVLGFYKVLPWLIRKAGLSISDVVIWEDEIEIKVAGGPSGVYGASLLFKPLRTLSAPFRNRIVSWQDTWRLSRFFLSGLKDYFVRPLALDKLSVLEYARKFSISEEAITRILGPLTAGLFFLPPGRYSAFVLFALLAQGMKRFYQTRVGAFSGGMSSVLAGPVARRIESLGGSVLTGTRVESLLMEGGKVKGVVAGGKSRTADQVVLATPLGATQRIIRRSEIDQGLFRNLLALPTMPEINLQLELSGPAWPVDRVVFCPGTSLITLSEQSRTTFKGRSGRLSVILSPPEKFIDMPPEEIFKVFGAEAPRIGIDPAKVIRYRVVCHPDDFYALSPGNEKLKPDTLTPFLNLFLAGDYVKQPFLATMEGAIISGRNAAEAVRKAVRRTGETQR